TAHLGVTYDYTYQGLGIRILSVPPRTPGSYAKSRLFVGDVIEQINGKTATLTDEFLNVALSDQVGRDVNLKVRGK
ncbi:PDZ domain-containing protein, partial [Acinetobacter baumannii]